MVQLVTDANQYTLKHRKVWVGGYGPVIMILYQCVVFFDSVGQSMENSFAAHYPEHVKTP
ncbi:hypothetical protein D3C85_1555280 [compost metagenome]